MGFLQAETWSAPLRHTGKGGRAEAFLHVVLVIRCEEMLSLCSISAGCFSFHMEIYRCKDIPYASSPAVSEAVNFENIGVEVGVDPFSVIKK